MSVEKTKQAMSQVKVVPMTPEIISQLILTGDVGKLLPVQKVEYITKLCDRVGLDPMTQPFKILRLNGREVLYADKGATQQLCQVYNITTEVTKKDSMLGVYVVTVRAKMPDGRFTDDDGAVTIEGLNGDALCNAIMKAITKAKRRAVLALCGLGMLDETEIETLPESVNPSAMVAETPIVEPSHVSGESEPIPETPSNFISEAQRKRLYAISMNAGMNKDIFKQWLLDKFSLESSKNIKTSEYDMICEEAEAWKA